MRIAFNPRAIPVFRHLRLDNGPLLIGIAAVAAVVEAAFLFSLFLPTTAPSTAAAQTESAAPTRIIGAASRGVVGAAPGSEVACGDQCLAQAAEKRPSHGARAVDLNGLKEVDAIPRAAAPSRDLKVAAPAQRDSFKDRFWPGPITTATIKPSTTGVAPKPPAVVAAPKPTEAVAAPKPAEVVVAPKPAEVAVAPKPVEVVVAPKPAEVVTAPETRTVVARPAREIRRPAAAALTTRTAATPAAAREVRSDIVRSPDGRQWKRTTYTASTAGGGTKTFQVTRPLEHHATWGVFGRGF
jgi:hypothetical protein